MMTLSVYDLMQLADGLTPAAVDAPVDTVRLTQSDDFDDTRVHVMGDGVFVIDQPSEDGEPNVVVIDRDMAVELVGILNALLKATR